MGRHATWWSSLTSYNLFILKTAIENTTEIYKQGGSPLGVIIGVIICVTLFVVLVVAIFFYRFVARESLFV